MMQSSQILQSITPYKGHEEKLVHNQGFNDIMRALIKEHELSAPEYDKFARPWWKGSPQATVRGIFDFCMANLKYNEETAELQTVRTPQAIIAEGRTIGVDCKHYSLFICGIVDSLRRMGYPIQAFYRFVAYPTKENANNTSPGHVFAVVMAGKQMIFVDPVLKVLDKRTPKYNSHIDKFPPDMALKRISGISNDQTLGAAPQGHFLDHQPVRGLISRSGQPFIAVGAQPYTTFTGSNGQPFMATMGNPFFNHGHRGHVHPYSMHHGHVTMQQHPHHLHHLAGMDTIGKKHHGLNLKKLHLPHIKIKAPHIKLPHIKIKNPLELLKKINPLLVTARNAFLLLLKKNVFGLAADIHNKAYNVGHGGKIDSFWKKVGGNTNKLHTAINQGVKNYNRHHANRKITGHGDYYNNNYTIGVAGADDAVEGGLLATALPIIIKITSILKALGIDTSKLHKGAQDGATKLAHAHNEKEGQANPDGSVDHQDEDGDIVNTKVDEAGNVKIKIKHGAANAHLNDGDDGGDGDDDAAPAGHHLDAPAGGGGGSTASADAQPLDSDAPGGQITKTVDNAFQKVTDFFGANQSKIVAGAGAAIGATIFLKGLNGPKRSKNTKMIAGGVLVAGSLAYYKFTSK